MSVASIYHGRLKYPEQRHGVGEENRRLRS